MNILNDSILYREESTVLVKELHGSPKHVHKTNLQEIIPRFTLNSICGNKLINFNIRVLNRNKKY